LNVGSRMADGKIIVKGDAGDWIGSGAKGGEIHLYGKHGTMAMDYGLKIFHKGEQISKK